MMRYGSVCSGIEAASVAWHPLGWSPSFFSEIEAHPRSILAHRWPGVPLHGDFSTIEAGQYEPIELLVGGTPCQSFSVAGLRGGLDDERGNLALEYLRLADRLRPRWLVWENVPGVLSSGDGRDFGSILGGMGELGYGWAYRVLDAQYVRVDGFGRAVPQRRRRVFVVGYFGDWRRASAVLFERACLSGHPAPRRQARKDVAPTISARTKGGGGLGTDFDLDGGLIAHSQAIVFDTTQISSPANRSVPKAGDPSHPLAAGAHPPALAFQVSESGVRVGDAHATLDANNGPRRHNGVIEDWAVRRLTPLECERLQGFPAGYTAIPLAKDKTMADGPRYRALGNSMAVNVMRWIGQRIAAVEVIQ